VWGPGVPPRVPQQEAPSEMTSEVPQPVWLLSTVETAKGLGISRAEVYELFASGALASVKVGRRRLVPAAEIDRFVAAKLAESADA
jgi:excisionase family DNA binding protein